MNPFKLLGSVASGGMSILNRLGSGDLLFDTVERYIDSMGNLIGRYKSIDAVSAKYIQALGGGSQAIQMLSNASIQAVKDLNISRRYNISTERLIEAQGKYADAIGRNVKVFAGMRDENGNIIEGTSTMENLAAMTKLLGESTAPLLEGMDLFAVSIDGASDRVARMHNIASKAGLSFAKYSDTVVKNFKIAQNYTFKNGLRGLESMAKKANELKMELSQVEAFANNIGDLEKSVNVAARLQVLGGPFAQFSDPLSMLNEGLNDIEGLQDRMIAMFGQLGTFNKQTGEIEVSAFTKRQIREATAAMGLDYSQMMSMVQSSARRNEVGAQIRSTVGENAFSKDMMDLILNTATFRNGRAVVTDGKNEYTMEQLVGNADLQQQLMAQYQDEGKDIKDIAFSVRSIEDIIKGFMGQVSASRAYTEANRIYTEGGQTITQNVVDVLTTGIDKYGISPNNLGELNGIFLKTYTYLAGQVGETIGHVLDEVKNAAEGKIGDWIAENLDIYLLGKDQKPGEQTFENEWFGKTIGDYIRRVFGSGEESVQVFGNGGLIDGINEKQNKIIYGNIPMREKKEGGEINGPLHSSIYGGTPILAEGGEYVMNRGAVEQFGGLFDYMNNIGLKKYDVGGKIGTVNMKPIPFDFSDSVLSLDSTNSDYIKDIAFNVRTLSVLNGRDLIKPVAYNGFNAFKVNEGNEQDIKRDETQTTKELNIKLSFGQNNSIYVKGDGTGKLNMSDLIRSSEFEDAVKKLIIKSVYKASDVAEKSLYS